MESQLYPWVATIERIFAASHLPRLHGSTMFVVSDYGGEHRKSRYDVISILVFDSETTGLWRRGLWDIRSRILKGKRRMSFKSLGDGMRRRALLPFLRAADTIPGVCATFIIRKEIKHLCTPPGSWAEFNRSAVFERAWNTRSFERAVCVTHFVSLLIAGLGHPNQNVYWISDEDALFANVERSEDTLRLVSAFTSYYAKYSPGSLGGGTTQIDDGNLDLEDLASVPDLVAGATAEIATSIAATYGGHIPVGLALSLPTTLSPKVRALSDWLADDTQPLKRPIVTFELAEGGAMRVSRLTLA